MIIQDKKKYLDYIKKTEEKVNNLYNHINSNLILETSREDIENIRNKIFRKLVVINVKLDAGELISSTYWEQYTKQVDELCTELETIVNTAIANAHLQQNQEYTSVNRR